MSEWLSLFCQTSTARITASQLLDGLRGRDPRALAGVDYSTLAEDYDVRDELVKPAVAALRVEALADGDGFEISYGEGERPVFVRRWTDPPRVAEEIQEMHDRLGAKSEPAAPWMRACREVIGIELSADQLRNMGVVIAYEAARYLAQKGDALILTDQDRWLRVEDGEFVPLSQR